MDIEYKLLAFWVFAFMQVADIYTTMTILDLGGREMNGFAKAAMDKLGRIPAMVLLKAAGIALIWILMPQLALWMICLFIAFYAWVLINNMNVIHRLKEKP
jgi:hypothetical protein